jgi:hypothetical protein
VSCSVCKKWVSPGTISAPKFAVGAPDSWEPPPERDSSVAIAFGSRAQLLGAAFAKRPSNGLWNKGHRSGGCLTRRHLAHQLAFRHLAYQLAPQDPRVPPRGSSSHPELRLTQAPHIRFCSHTCLAISCPCRHRNPRVRMSGHHRRRRSLRGSTITKIRWSKSSVCGRR